MLSHALLAALCALAATELARVAPGLSRLYQRGVKPLACDTCMSLWTAVGASAALEPLSCPGGLGPHCVAALAAVGAVRLALGTLSRPPPGPPPLDQLEDGGVG